MAQAVKNGKKAPPAKAGSAKVAAVKPAKTTTAVTKPTKTTAVATKPAKTMPAATKQPATRVRAKHSPLRKILGRNVQAARKEAKLTKGGLSVKSRVSQHYIDLIEKGETNTSLDVIDALAKHLGKTAVALITSPVKENRLT